MHEFDLLLTLTGGLAAALLLGYLTQRAGLSPIVGYIISGLIVGPHTPGFVANHELAEQLAEIGVILLMFGVGLHFHLKELLAVRRVALPGAIGQSLIATLLGALAARWFGWNWSAGVVFGLAISVASTVVLTRVLTDNRELHTPTGHIAVGWLVVEDLFTVLVLVLMPALFGPGGGAGGAPLALALALVKLGVLVAFTFLVGGRVIPWLLEKVAATRSRELFTLTILVLALGIAIGSAKLFGASMALGAFLAGMVVGQSDFSVRAASEALPMRDAFAVLFFVSVGMLLDPWAVAASPGILITTLVIILLGKPLAALAIVLGLGYPVRTAFSVAVALAQIGEFSFILAGLGNQLGVLTDVAYNTVVAAAIVSIALNPLLYRLVAPAEAWASRRPLLWRALNAFACKPAAAALIPVDGGDEASHRAVIVGYGPVGSTVARLLRENSIIPTVIELNLKTVQRLHQEGISAIYGDAHHRDTLSSAGVDHARALILTAGDLHASAEIIRLARSLNPNIRVLARSAYIQELCTLREAGADAVFSGEGEVALALTEAILTALGATPEQIDRERARVRSEVAPPAPPKAASAASAQPVQPV